MSNLSDDKRARLEELRRKKEEENNSRNNSTTTTTTTTKTTVNSGGNNGSRLPGPNSSSTNSSTNSSSSTNLTPSTTPSKAERKRLAQEALNNSSRDNSSNQGANTQRANTQNNQRANTQTNQRSTSNLVQSYQSKPSNQASNVNTSTRNTNTMSRQQQQTPTTTVTEEVTVIDTPRGLTEGVAIVLSYYLSTWAFWRPYRFLSARFTETIILYVFFPGFIGAISGIINPNPLPKSAPQVMKDTHNFTSGISGFTSHVLLPTLNQTINEAGNEFDRQEREKLENQGQGKVIPFYQTPSPDSYEERVLEKLGQ